jgi:CBS domain-containing protein
MFARDLMTPLPAVIAAGDTIADAAELMRVRGVGMLPVVENLENRRLVGVITDRDIVLRHVAPGHGAGARIREHMTREPLATVLPVSSVEEIAEMMSRHQVRRVPVVDEAGVVVGIVAAADLALAVGPKDPQLVERVIAAVSRPGALVH